MRHCAVSMRLAVYAALCRFARGTTMSNAPFMPTAIYAEPLANQMPPRVLVAPPRYVQGPGALQHIGRYLSVLTLSRVAIVASARGHGAQAGEVAASLGQQGIECVAATFGGECSLQEIETHASALEAEKVDCLIAVGGGKCVDAGKCIAHRLDVPIVVVPTLASNDAPCSAVSVLYTPEGVVSGAEFFPANPVLVVVDTQVVADAAERYLVAGMGDAMATWYEARVCYENPQAFNVMGGRPTLASCAMGEVCASTLYDDGVAAAQAVRDDCVDEALERVVEANTLLSGVGFESGGLAAAHGLAQGYTTLPEVEHDYLHGEMVAMGVVTQLVMQQDVAEATRVTEFFAQVGLPVHLGQIGLARDESARLDSVVMGAMEFAPIHNLPFDVQPEAVMNGILDADTLGREVAGRVGDAAYRRLRSAR